MKSHPSQSCQHYPECGGCDLLHFEYVKQLQKKQEYIEDLFLPFKDLEIRKIIPSPQNQFYRHKVQIPFSQRKIGSNMVLTLGLHNKERSFIIDQKECRIQDRDLTIVSDAIRHWARKEELSPYNEKHGIGLLRHVVLRKSSHTKEILVGLVMNENDIPGRRKIIPVLVSMIKQFLSNEKSEAEVVGVIQNVNDRKTKVVLGRNESTWFGRNFIKEKIGEFEFHIGLSTFFQVNPFQIENMYSLISEEIHPGSNVVDAYCGIGTISLFISGKAGKITGLEDNPNSVRSANLAAKANNVENVKFIEGNIADTLQVALKDKPDIVIVDPPRDGLDSRTVEILLDSKVKKIVYASCDPETLFRDCDELSDKFHLDRLTPIDMFPHTSHIESVAVLVR